MADNGIEIPNGYKDFVLNALADRSVRAKCKCCNK